MSLIIQDQREWLQSLVNIDGADVPLMDAETYLSPDRVVRTPTEDGTLNRRRWTSGQEEPLTPSVVGGDLLGGVAPAARSRRGIVDENDYLVPSAQSVS